jgi:DNA-binding PadR family transcriptional regulator
MNDEEKSKLERELKRAAPLLNRLGDGADALPDHVRARLNAALDRKMPPVRELTERQMEALMLKLIAEQPAEGFELINHLSRGNFKLRGGTEGVIYGLLNRLEQRGMIAGRWRETDSSMRKTYHVTENGTRQLNRELASCGELQGWASLVLQRE